MQSRIPLFRVPDDPTVKNLVAPISRVLKRGNFVLGPEVSGFERKFSEYCGVAHCVSVASGTDALDLALRAVGVRQGDKVMLVANAGFYGSTAVHLIGAIPHYLDVDQDSLNLDPEEIVPALKNPPAAIIVTHLYGQLAEIEQIVKLAEKMEVPVIEDCAQSHGAMRGGRRAGSFGTVGCFSFYPTKNLGALGDGGAIVTQNEQVAAKLRQLRQYGWGIKYHVELPGGLNSRLDEIQAAILSDKLPLLDGWNAERRRIAGGYNEAFVDLPVSCPPSTGQDYVAHLYVLRVQNRSAFRNFLNKNGVATDVHYPVPDHFQPAYQCEQKRGRLVVTEQTCESVVTLPCFPGMTDVEISQVIGVVRGYFEQGAK
jgi:dTDP-4-amino-4,6-dideoxygalactose transaminase